jgi:SAM-dependent methyltransferase
MMSDSSKDSQKQGISAGRIRELSRAFQSSRVFLTGYELDVFSVLGDEEKTSEEVAGVIGTDPRGTDRLLNALCALELLTKSGDIYANSPVASRFLVKGKPDYQSGLMHTVHLWDSWTTLTGAVRHGGTIMQRPTNERGREWLEAFIAAMHARAAVEAPFVIGKLDLAGVSRVLDVGGGSGAFSMAFVRAGDGLESTVFDLPNVVPLTQGYIEREGLSGRIHTVPGNYHTDELGAGFDLAFLSAIIHSNSFEQNQELVHKVSRALNPGGRIVISDFIMEDTRVEPMFGAFFALNMLVGTPAGDTYTESEIKTWMEEAGITFTERIDLGPGTGLMIGAKE